jgi:hypoxanthine phosphoribosyltransferase
MGQTKAVIEPQLVTDINFNVEDKEIIIIEDIIDSGKTIKMVVDLLKQLGAKDVKIIALINKKEGRKIELEPDYYCFSIPLHFIIGFGLDYKGYFRNLPFIGILSDDFINNNDL